MAYFTAIDLGNRIHFLYELLGVGSHLIVGDQKALLIDTGYGYGNLREVALKVTDKPLIVINSHVHPDHSLGNGLFEEVYVGERDLPSIHNGQLQKLYEMLLGYGKKKVPALYFILLYAKIKHKPSYDTAYRTLSSASEFDLGGRVIRFMQMPGHTPGSMIMLDAHSKSVFAGDAVNPHTLLHFDRTLKLVEYATQLDELAALPDYERLYTSHLKEPLPFSFVSWFADFLRRVQLEKSVVSDLPNYGRPVYEYIEYDGRYGKCSVCFDADNVDQ